MVERLIERIRNKDQQAMKELYVEPSLGYYFNDGTSYQHYYKDHPLAPSIMLGLRMHIE